MVRCSILRDLFKRNGKDLKYGGVAQLGEHLPCKQGVMGSNPIISTSTMCDRKEGLKTDPANSIVSRRRREYKAELTRVSAAEPTPHNGS